MRDAVPGDAVPTVRATLARAGRTDRPKIALPDDDSDRFPADETIRLLLDGDERHARVERALDESLELRSVRDNARQVDEGDGDDRLREWVDDAGLEFGRTVHVDVLDEGHCYGLRPPGESTVYRVPDRPDDSLAAIAEEVAESACEEEQ